MGKEIPDLAQDEVSLRIDSEQAEGSTGKSSSRKSSKSCQGPPQNLARRKHSGCEACNAKREQGEEDHSKIVKAGQRKKSSQLERRKSKSSLKDINESSSHDHSAKNSPKEGRKKS